MDGEFLRAMKNIDKNLARIADALEKMTAPSGQGREIARDNGDCCFSDETKEEMGKFQASFENAYYGS